MDLSRCRLAVLSACRTAQGVVSSDGVLGLQRGLKMAGTQTVILSLWDVNDQATQLLMTEFYRYHIASGLPVRQAFQRAQQAVRQKYEEPDYWAAFILID
jgi:CHAT domain-containing protein